MRKYLQKKFTIFLVKHLFNGVTENDCLKVAGTKIYHRGRLLTAGEKKELVTGAQTVLGMKAFQTVIDELTWAANSKIYQKGQNMEEINFARAMLYNIEILVKKLDSLSRM